MFQLAAACLDLTNINQQITEIGFHLFAVFHSGLGQLLQNLYLHTLCFDVKSQEFFFSYFYVSLIWFCYEKNINKIGGGLCEMVNINKKINKFFNRNKEKLMCVSINELNKIKY